MDKLRKMLGLNEKISWQNLAKNPNNFIINEIERLYRKIDDNEVEKQINILEKKKRCL